MKLSLHVSSQLGSGYLLVGDSMLLALSSLVFLSWFPYICALLELFF